jgi:serine/threonine protein phosphatase PrpC
MGLLTASGVSVTIESSEDIAIGIAVAEGAEQHTMKAAQFVAQQLSMRASDWSSISAGRASLANTNDAVFDEMARDIRLSGMSAAASGIVICGEQISFFTVGSGRIFELRDGYLIARPDCDVGTQNLRDTERTPHFGGSENSIEGAEIDSSLLELGAAFLIVSDDFSSEVSLESLESEVGTASGSDALQTIVRELLKRKSTRPSQLLLVSIE